MGVDGGGLQIIDVCMDGWMDEGGLQVIDDIEVIILLYSTSSPVVVVALIMVFVIHTILHL